MISLDIWYQYGGRGKGFLPHVDVVTSHQEESVKVLSGDKEMNLMPEFDGLQQRAHFIQEDGRENITVICGDEKFVVEQVKGEPWLIVHEDSLPLVLRMNGFYPFDKYRD